MAICKVIINPKCGTLGTIMIVLTYNSYGALCNSQSLCSWESMAYITVL